MALVRGLCRAFYAPAGFMLKIHEAGGKEARKKARSEKAILVTASVARGLGFRV